MKRHLFLATSHEQPYVRSLFQTRSTRNSSRSVNREWKELVLHQRATVLYHPLVGDLAKVAVFIPAPSSQWKSDGFFFVFFFRNMPRFTIFPL